MAIHSPTSADGPQRRFKQPTFSRANLESAFRIGRPEISIRELDSYPILILDGFYADPDTVQSLATSLDYDVMYGVRQYRNYPGQRAQVSLHLAAVIDRMLDEYAKYSPHLSLTRRHFLPQPLLFTRMNDHLLERCQPHQQVPHIDIDCVLIALIYLSRLNGENGGTYFYRHRETGLSHLPPSASPQIHSLMRHRGFDVMSEHGYRDFLKSLMQDGVEQAQKMLGKSGLDADTESWEIIQRVEYQFNRAVVFPARNFHSPVYTARKGSKTPSEYRLTQNYFFGFE